MVEFVQGIPTDLDEDDYFDSKVNNLLILDDMMSVSAKDTRITELFTEGSHHRSLSVISINQNMFATKTQLREEIVITLCYITILLTNKQ